jgi:hypothetical protein
MELFDTTTFGESTNDELIKDMSIDDQFGPASKDTDAIGISVNVTKIFDFFKKIFS